MKNVILNNGVEMLILGFGVYQVPDYNECKKSILTALETGYRSIDTAQAYGNEKAVGDAIKESGIPREEIFVTTKLWISDYGYDKARAAFENLGKTSSWKPLTFTSCTSLLTIFTVRGALWKIYTKKRKSARLA